MKILAFTDTHGSRKALKNVKKKSKEADILICCGDLTIFEQGLPALLRELNDLKKTVLMMPGNHESRALKRACTRYRHILYLDEQVIKFQDTLFMGIEGSGFSLKDKHFEKISKTLVKKTAGKDFVLVTHAPPYKTRLDRLQDGHCGNMSIRKFIEKAQPIIALCGHIHENEGRADKIGRTKVYNPGPHGQVITI